MAIFAVGAYYDEDVSSDFIENKIAGLDGIKLKLQSYINFLVL